MKPALKDDVCLKPHQQRFVDFAVKLEQLRRGGILADGMGLGKSLQALALVLNTWRPGDRTLIICKKKNIDTWIQQIHQYTKNVRYCIQTHDTKYAYDRQADIVIVNYSAVLTIFKRRNVVPFSQQLLCSKKAKAVVEDHPELFIRDECMYTRAPLSKDSANIFGRAWRRIFMDESHDIRNVTSKKCTATRFLHSRHYWLLTGTLINNTPEDALTGLLLIRHGELVHPPLWKKYYNDAAVSHMLSQVMLRRTVNELREAGDETALNMGSLNQYVHLTPFQSEEEQAAYHQLEENLRTITDQMYMKRSCNKRLRAYGQHIGVPETTMTHVLTRLLRCRQACIAYILAERGLDGLCGQQQQQFMQTVPDDWRGTGSTKMKLLVHYATKRMEIEEKMLVFSCFVEALLLAHVALKRAGVASHLLIGGMTSSQTSAVLQKFRSQSGRCVLLISMKISTGFNIPEATRVILLDPDWNPATEQQAGHRSHRLTQKKNVVLTRFLIANTIEEKVHERSKEKQSVIDNLMSGGGSSSSSFINHRTQHQRKRKQQPGLRSLEGIRNILCDSDAATICGDEELQMAELKNTIDRVGGVALLHNSILTTKYNVPEGSFVFGFSYKQTTEWYIDPFQLLQQLCNCFEHSYHVTTVCTSKQPDMMLSHRRQPEYCTKSNVDSVYAELQKRDENLLSHISGWLSQQCVHLFVSRVKKNIPTHCLKSKESLPLALIQSHTEQLTELQFDCAQLLYFRTLKTCYDKQHSALPLHCFDCSGCVSQAGSQLVQKLCLCRDRRSATTLFLATVFWNTDNCEVYFSVDEADLNIRPLLFFFLKNKSSLYIVSCDPKLQSQASQQLLKCFDDIRSNMVLLYVPLYMGSQWFEGLQLQGVVRHAKHINTEAFWVCYSLFVLTDSQQPSTTFSAVSLQELS